MEESGTESIGEVPLQAEQRIVNYLRQHPDFFLRHLELLTALQIPHGSGEGAVSLVERQVQVLRHQQQQQLEQLQSLVNTARENERLTERLHRLVLEVLAFEDSDTALDSLPPLLMELFDIQQAVIRVEHEQRHGERPEIAHPSEPAFIEVRARVTHGRSVSDDRLPSALLEYLFGDGSAAVVSCMLVPLGGGQPTGVLALASEQHGRFRADHGTVYLDRLGEILGASLRRLLG